MSDILKLAERCEAATGPDRELDRDIELALPGVLPHPDGTRFDNDLSQREPYVISGAGHPDYEPGQGYIPSRYTASLDAAMMLVPEGYRLTGLAETIIECPNPWCANLQEKKRNTKKLPIGDAATAPLAVCAAALRARGDQ